MAKKSHPYIEAVKISALIFFSSLLMIIFLALYVEAEVRDNRRIEPAKAEENLAPPGRLYLR